MMKYELKMPPLLVTVTFGAIAWLLSIYTQPLNVNTNIQMVICSLFLVTGSLFLVSSLRLFNKKKTTINPFNPQATTVIVTTGIYSYSRNPMYLSMLLYLFSWGFFLDNIFSILVCIGFVLHMNFFQIFAEERVLIKKFGDQYKAYLKKVRRWL